MSALSRGWRTLRWFTAEVLGDSGYDRYVARHRLEHPDHPPLDAKSWWRQRDAAAERRVQTGCC